MQARAYYGGVPIESQSARDLIEYDLMEEYHWLPKDIAEISSKTMKKMLIIKKNKIQEHNRQVHIQEFKNKHTSGRGQSKRSFTREV